MKTRAGRPWICSLLNSACPSQQLGTSVMLIFAALLSGCGRHAVDSHGSDTGQTATAGSAPHQITRSHLSAAERAYGIAPVPDASVTYQPDVILIGGGPQAVRAQDPNGFTWTIDASAPRAAELAPGKVFFMTGRVVGRVLAVKRDGDKLVIVAGPIKLTDLVKEAHIEIKNMPIDLNEAVTYTADDLPGQQVLAQRLEPNVPSLAINQRGGVPVHYVTESGWRAYAVDDLTSAVPAPPGASHLPSLPAAPPVPDVQDVSSALLEKNFKLLPNLTSSGVGLSVSADGGGLKVSASTLVGIEKPTLNLRLIIKDAAIQEATIELAGATGLSWTFAAGTSLGLKGNVHALLQPNTDFSVLIGGIGPLPMAVTVRQRFLIKTGLGVRNSTLTASGQYTFGGSFRVSYSNGKWGAAGPSSFAATHSMARSTGGLSLGAEGLNLANQLKVIVGVGAYGFTTGPYVSFTSAVGAFRGSDIGMIACSGATINISLYGGVGYVIPKGISAVINTILQKLSIPMQVSSEGGIESDSKTLIRKTSAVGGCGLETGAPVGNLAGPV